MDCRPSRNYPKAELQARLGAWAKIPAKVHEHLAGDKLAGIPTQACWCSGNTASSG
jgi:hypothetical protein